MACFNFVVLVKIALYVFNFVYIIRILVQIKIYNFILKQALLLDILIIYILNVFNVIQNLVGRWLKYLFIELY